MEDEVQVVFLTGSGLEAYRPQIEEALLAGASSYQAYETPESILDSVKEGDYYICLLFDTLEDRLEALVVFSIRKYPTQCAYLEVVYFMGVDFVKYPEKQAFLLTQLEYFAGQGSVDFIELNLTPAVARVMGPLNDYKTVCTTLRKNLNDLFARAN